MPPKQRGRIDAEDWEPVREVEWSSDASVVILAAELKETFRVQAFFVLARVASALLKVWSKNRIARPAPARPAPARPAPARPAPRDKSPDPKRGANLLMKFAKVVHFQTPGSPEPVRGLKLTMKIAIVARGEER